MVFFENIIYLNFNTPIDVLYCDKYKYQKEYNNIKIDDYSAIKTYYFYIYFSPKFLIFGRRSN